MPSLGALDSCVVSASLLSVFGVAAFSSYRRKKNQPPTAGAESFFLAGRHMPWWLVGASLFASNIGTEHFVGQAGTAASHGIAAGLYDWVAAYMILALGWVFAPVYLRCHLTTIPELLEKRFNKQCRFAFVLITLIAYAISKIGSSLYAGVVVLEIVAGLGVWESLPLILLATGIYTVAGGLEMIIFLAGGVIGSGIAFSLVGGMDGLVNWLKEANLGDFPHLLRPATDESFPWPGMLFGIPIVSIWYWCVDQEMAQRVMSAKNLGEAQLGTSFAGLFKTIPVFVTVFPGMISRVLYEKCLIGKDSTGAWCDANLSDSHAADKAYPLLVVNEFPIGVKGIMVASFLAAMMSSLSSVFNSASTIFTYDIYLRFWNPDGHVQPKKLVKVGRFATIGTVVIAFGWIPIIAAQKGGLFVVTQTAMSHLAPPVSALFIAALFLPRVNGQGALFGLLLGTFFGSVRLLVFLFSDNSICSTLSFSNWGICLNFNYFAILLFGLSLAVIIIASFVFPGQDKEQIADYMVYRIWARNYTWNLSPLKFIEMHNMRYGALERPEKESQGKSGTGRNGRESPEAGISNRLSEEEAAGHQLVPEDSNGKEKQLIAAIVSFVVVVLITSLIIVFH